MNQTRDIEDLEIVKERKCESSPDPCLSDQSLVKDIRVILKLLRQCTHSPKSVFNLYLIKHLKTLKEIIKLLV